jgi:sugar/nucleoside kinase (ribokinase family)
MLTGETSPKAAAAALSACTEHVLITLGKDGSLFRTSQSVISVEAVAVPQVVDTTGAGDAFIAGFAAARSQGCLDEVCLQRGHQLAAEIIQQYGCR